MQDLVRDRGITRVRVYVVENAHQAPSLGSLLTLSVELRDGVGYLLTGRETATSNVTPAIDPERDLTLAAKRFVLGLVHELLGRGF
jgi:hypothetical protein